MSWVTYNCPHCGKEFKVSVNENAGASTVHAVCSNCHKNYSYTKEHGRIKVSK
jgi:transcription elongation factor Elf1